MINAVLIRIIGNNLPPRHSSKQNVKNLQYIIDNECPFENCKKLYVINRILNDDNHDEIKSILDEADLDYLDIPVVKKSYLECGTDFERRNYLTNCNGARNEALDFGMSYDADMVLPLDGNCFFREDAWYQLTIPIIPSGGYVIIMMARGTDLSEIDEGKIPSWFENYQYANKIVTSATEPQIGFFRDYDKKYDERYPYGMASKVNLLFKLGMPGIWDRWFPQERRKALSDASEHYGSVCQLGWCYRLPSGVNEAEGNNTLRGKLRDEAVKLLIEEADDKFRT